MRQGLLYWHALFADFQNVYIPHTTFLLLYNTQSILFDTMNKLNGIN
jgi:hypothetical protein